MAEELRAKNPLPYEAELPTDVVAAAAFEEDAESRVAPYDEAPDGWLGLDVGPTRARFAALIGGARTVFWNGPMGVFEWSQFAEGTKAVAQAVADVDGFTVVEVATPFVRSPSSVSPNASHGSRRAAVPRSSCSKELPGVAAIPPL